MPTVEIDRKYVQCRHSIPALNARAKYMNARLIFTQFLEHGCMDDLSSERSFSWQATRVINVLGFCFEM